ncbi:hypothetical protein HMI54_006167 [Coelomomyces lativittatus]|nr:hypothetical protein HMI54_006167 [Coelomomyces lativittatus]
MIGNMKTWQDLYSLKNLNLSVNCLLFDPSFNFEVIIPFKFQKTNLTEDRVLKKSLCMKENLNKKN